MGGDLARWRRRSEQLALQNISLTGLQSNACMTQLCNVLRMSDCQLPEAAAHAGACRRCA